MKPRTKRSNRHRYLPTPEQIRSECRRIREEHDREKLNMDPNQVVRPRYVIPTFRVTLERR